MSFTPRTLVRLGLTAALLSTTSLAACGGENGSDKSARDETAARAGDTDAASVSDAAMTDQPSQALTASTAGEGGESGEGEGGEDGAASMDTLPLQNRLAFMRGHVEAGLALYRAGVPDQAARHLLHPVSETHAEERAGLDDLGFKGDLFVDISKQLEAGTASTDIESELTEAEENLDMLAGKAGGTPADIINFLMDTTVEEYRVGVVDGEIVNAGEYQDAFGFVTVANGYADDLRGDEGEAVRTELERLLALWPDAPLAASTPTPVDEVAAQVARVQLELSALR